MCLSLEMQRPQDVLESGTLHGHEYRIMANREAGGRCGYVKVEAGHPWHGADYDLEVDVHGGITFAAKDVPCEAAGDDTGYWVGFDCGHAGDLRDVDLIEDPFLKDFYRDYNANMVAIDDEFGICRSRVWDTASVRVECARLALQASEAYAMEVARIISAVRSLLNINA
jgi:hypothetical protein